MRTYLLLLTTLTACVPPYPLPYHYYSRCVNVDAEIALDQTRIDNYINKTAEIFEAAFPGESWCGAMGSRGINVYDGSWPCVVTSVTPGTPSNLSNLCDGFTDIPDPIEINGASWALVHESLHLRDIRNGDLTTMFHGNWDKKNYWNIAQRLEDSGVMTMADLPIIPNHGSGP